MDIAAELFFIFRQQPSQQRIWHASGDFSYGRAPTCSPNKFFTL
jgi:hypothetical protein